MRCTACVDTDTPDVNSLARWKVLALGCLLARDSQTVPQWVSVSWEEPLQVCPELDPHIRF